MAIGFKSGLSPKHSQASPADIYWGGNWCVHLCVCVCVCVCVREREREREKERERESERALGNKYYPEFSEKTDAVSKFAQTPRESLSH